MKKCTAEQRAALETAKENLNPEYVPSSITATPSFMEAFGEYYDVTSQSEAVILTSDQSQACSSRP